MPANSTIQEHAGELFRPGQTLDREPVSNLRIRFQDCDPHGHLNNGRYLDYFINAREDHLRECYDLDIYSDRFAERNWVVRSSLISHRAPARANQPVQVQTRLMFFDRNRLQMQGIMRALPSAGREEQGTEAYGGISGQILAVARLEFRYFQLATGRPCRHEAPLLELFERISLGRQLDFGDADRREAS